MPAPKGSKFNRETGKYERPGKPSEKKPEPEPVIEAPPQPVVTPPIPPPKPMPSPADLADEPMLTIPELSTPAPAKPGEAPKAPAKKPFQPISGHLVTLSAIRIHKMVAKMRKTNVYLLDEEGKEIYDTIGNWIVANLDFRNLPILLACLALLAMWGQMIGEDLAGRTPPPPKPDERVPPGASGDDPTPTPHEGLS